MLKIDTTNIILYYVSRSSESNIDEEVTYLVCIYDLNLTPLRMINTAIALYIKNNSELKVIFYIIHCHPELSLKYQAKGRGKKRMDEKLAHY